MIKLMFRHGNEELNLIALAKHFSDEDKAREFLEKLRWPEALSAHIAAKSISLSA